MGNGELGSKKLAVNEPARPKGCRLCGSMRQICFLRLKNSPANISFLLRPEQFDQDAPVDLEVWLCQECGFVQVNPIFTPEFYKEYLMTASHSSQMQHFQQAQARNFVQRFRLQGKRIIEIGCGDGNYLQCLQSAGALVAGIEPSARFRAVALKRGCTVHAGYVGQGVSIPGAPYDAFVTRQVLEHVPDVVDFLLGIRESLQPDAVGLVEVPSLEQALDGIRFYDFFADHLNYFSAHTLRLALERTGYEVIDISRGMTGEYHVAQVRVHSQQALLGFRTSVDEVLDDLRKFMATCRRNNKRVAVWGAGGKGVSLMAIAQLKDVAYVIDSDPYKHKLFTPITHFLVVPPIHLLKEPVDVIILTALAYKNEILQELRQQLKFRGTVVALGTRLEVLNP